ncbi:MAG: hypothetical protein NZZ60_00040 [Bacteroidia bacterium]|nr:hypothetical protein [Bacteroidia bacterium]MCX7652320.1 hypothetical protein [Bacteroidia bacterium]MDW8417273.1 hypothetical protein [Bacteroidia bacterium]
MLNTKPSQLIHRGRGLLLPLLLLSACRENNPKNAPSPLEAIPPAHKDSLKSRLYPLIAGSHAKNDSVIAYRWELWEMAGDTLYFGLSRPARSLYPNRREAVVGRCILKDTGVAYYEELFWTYKFPQDTIHKVVEGVFLAWRRGTSLDSFQENYISFPDPFSFYDVKRRAWRRIVGKDTISNIYEL